MRKSITLVAILVATTLAGAGPAFAHHGAAAFDAGKVVTLQATITEWVWSNPHCFLKFDVADASGAVQHWVAETSNPPDMINRGWARNSFKTGDKVTVNIEPVKSGAPVGRVLDVTFPDGKVLSTGGAVPAPLSK